MGLYEYWQIVGTQGQLDNLLLLRKSWAPSAREGCMAASLIRFAIIAIAIGKKKEGVKSINNQVVDVDVDVDGDTPHHHPKDQ